jgi:hypothetical protein
MTDKKATVIITLDVPMGDISPDRANERVSKIVRFINNCVDNHDEMRKSTRKFETKVE